jgi:hypothetical protein
MNTEQEGAMPDDGLKKPFEQNEINEPENEVLHTDPHKALMLAKLVKYMGIVSYAANEANISRRTHYNWLKTDAGYKEAVDLICEICLDFSESRLFNYLKEDDLRAIIFVLRTKGQKRGYSYTKEKQAEPERVFNIVVQDQKSADLIKKVMGQS